MDNTLDLKAIEARYKVAARKHWWNASDRLHAREKVWTEDIPVLMAEVERLREELELHKELYVFSENDMGVMRAQRDGARDVCAFYRKQLRTFADHYKAAPSIRCWSTRYWLKLRALTKGRKNG